MTIKTSDILIVCALAFMLLALSIWELIFTFDKIDFFVIKTEPHTIEGDFKRVEHKEGIKI